MIKPIGLDVLAVIKDHLDTPERTRSLDILKNSSFSFEQWVNAEAYIACNEAGYVVQGTTKYAGGLSALMSDLVVWDKGTPDDSEDFFGDLIVETKILKYGTKPAYFHKIAADRQKLISGIMHSPSDAIQGLQLVFVYGVNDESSKIRDRILKTLSKAFLPRGFSPIDEAGRGDDSSAGSDFEISEQHLAIGNALLLAWIIGKKERLPNFAPG